MHNEFRDESQWYGVGAYTSVAVLRIRPKLMTAIGAILALSPLGISLGAQMAPMAVIGGFVVALPVLLFVLPTGVLPTGVRLIYHHVSKPEAVEEERAAAPAAAI